MGDGAANSPEAGIMLQGESLQGKGRVSLYKSLRFNVFVPEKPKIPLDEGLHVQVSSGHDKSDSPRQVLARHFMAEGVAKILTESSQTRDAWANTRIEDGQKISVYGRVPGEEASWRKPVDTVDRNVPPISELEPFYETKRLQELSGRYLPKWEQHLVAGKIELFKDGVNETDVEPSSGEDIVWQNDKFILNIVLDPHIDGIHLVVNPKESFKRQWQTIKGSDSDQEQPYIQSTLEATAIAMGVQKILTEGKGEIHNSGNWAPYLRTIDDGGRFDLRNFQEKRIEEKRSHRPDIATPEKQLDTSVHVHIYIPKSGSVVLPSMPRGEAVEEERHDIVKQWDEIPNPTPEQVNDVKSELGKGRLASWLEVNCKGNI